MAAVELDHYQTIVNVNWPVSVTHLAFQVELQPGSPQANVSMTCAVGGPATGAVMGSYCPVYTYRYEYIDALYGRRGDGTWDDSVSRATITGLPGSDVETFPIWTVSGQDSQLDFSRISPVTGGAEGILLPLSTSEFFSTDVSAYAELYTVAADGTGYCVNPNYPVDPGPLDHFIGANTINGGLATVIGQASATILSRVTVVYRGVTFTPAGSFTVERTPGDSNPSYPAGVNFPKRMWCLFANPNP